MILIDANLLLYSYDGSSPHHHLSRAWLEQTLNGDEVVLLPWASLLAFLRISTNARAMSQPLMMDEAVQAAGELLAHPNVRPVQAGDRHWEILSRLCVDAQVRGPLVSDAHLAALAVEHGAVMFSADRGFARFKGLRWKNPLEAG